MRKLSPEKVRELREGAWMSQQDLADASGFSLFTVQRIERGDGAVRPGTGRAIAKALGVTPDELTDAPKVAPPRDRPAEPSAGGSGESHLLAERRLLSSLHPFAAQVEARTEYWRGLVESGRVNQYTLDYATEEMAITARGFKALTDAAVAEDWSPAELRLLRRVYESIAGPYRETWNALLGAWVEGAADAQGSRRLRLVTKADEAMRLVEEADEAVRTAA